MPDLIHIDPEPANASVIAYLEHVLSRAREGEFSSIAIAWVYRDGTTGSGTSDVPSLPALTGAVAALQGKLVADMIDG
jgi:hypothetical protein